MKKYVNSGGILVPESTIQTRRAFLAKIASIGVLVAGPAFARRRFQPIISAGGGGLVLLESSISGVGAGAWPFGDANTGFYAGQTVWTNGSNRNIKQITVPLAKNTGTIVGQTFTLRIWTLDAGTGALVTNVASSTGVAGSDAWNLTNVDFTFASAYSYGAGTSIGFTIDSGTDSASNFANGYFTTPSIINGNLCSWDSSKNVTSNFLAFDFQLAIYVQ